MTRRILTACLLLLLGLAAAGAWLAYGLLAPGPADRDLQLVLPRGEGAERIAARLAEAGVLRDRWSFLAAAYASGAAGRLKAGEYRFPARASGRAVLDLLVAGRTVVRRLTVPEGLTSAQIVHLLQTTEGLTGSVEPPPEGTLLPETYHYSWGDERAALLARMRRAMEETLAELWPRRQPNLPFDTPGQALVLASIVEKETGLKSERPQVAGVFVNRLRRGMKLQSDPTVIYGVTQGRGGFDRPIGRADLEADNAWNTYRIDGLPPTPIANPGRASIEAALQPQPTRALYFVADGNGGHAFAETLEQHNANVRRWRALERQKSD